MESYAERFGHSGHFEVTYRAYSRQEGGRETPLRQHLRLDFMYEGDNPKTDGLNMVWPEFFGSAGRALPAGEVPSSGVARMFIVDPARIAYHRSRLAVGTRGFFMEGPHKVAECEIRALLAVAP